MIIVLHLQQKFKLEFSLQIYSCLIFSFGRGKKTKQNDCKFQHEFSTGRIWKDIYITNEVCEFGYTKYMGEYIGQVYINNIAS